MCVCVCDVSDGNVGGSNGYIVGGVRYYGCYDGSYRDNDSNYSIPPPYTTTYYQRTVLYIYYPNFPEPANLNWITEHFFFFLSPTSIITSFNFAVDKMLL